MKLIDALSLKSLVRILLLQYLQTSTRSGRFQPNWNSSVIFSSCWSRLLSLSIRQVYLNLFLRIIRITASIFGFDTTNVLAIPEWLVGFAPCARDFTALLTVDWLKKQLS